ncbi:MAG TPA: protein kinase [Humisphaera sp.]
MNPDVDSNTAARVLGEALSLPPARRGEYLDRACAGDPALRQEVDSLLRESEADPEFLCVPAAGSTAHLASAAVDSALAATGPGDLPVVPGFTLRRLVGTGATAAVFEAVQDRPPRRVALKLLRHPLPADRDVRRFEFETEVLAGLDHPGIARLFETDQFTVAGRSQPFLVMEFVDGRPLDQAVRELRLGVRETVSLVLDVVDAVASAHRRGVVHRDLKPANILVTDEQAVKVVDFGVARLLGHPNGDVRLTLAGSVVGTPSYMPPEQAEGRDEQVDHRADVYALGAILYEALAGHPPLDLTDLSRADYVRAIATREPAPLRSARRSVPRDLDLVVGKALSKRRRDRYVDAGALGDDLRRFLAHQPVVARRPTVLYKTARFLRRHRVAAAAVAALLAAAAVVARPYLRKSAFEVSVRAMNAQELELAWPDSFSGETQYVIERLVGNEWGELMTLPAGSTSATLGGMEPSRVYNYRVRADGALGTLGYSRIASIVMPTADWRSPGRFRAAPPKPTSVRLAWSARHEDSAYKLRMSTAGNRAWRDVVDLMPGTSAYDVDGLSPGTTYFFQVAAVIPSGRLLWSLPLQVDTPGSATQPSKGSKVPTGAPAETAVD